VFGEPGAGVCELGSRRNQMIHAQSVTFPALSTQPPGGTRDRGAPEVQIERQRWNFAFLCPAVSEARRAV
jgi:hypothetical protein